MEEEEKKKRGVSEVERQRREAAKEIAPLKYWDFYVDYRAKHMDNDEHWTRKKFLTALQSEMDLEMPPSSSAITGKHNYCTDTLIPKLGKDRESIWYGMTKKKLEAATLPPTAKSSREDWEQAEDTAGKTKKMFG